MVRSPLFRVILADVLERPVGRIRGVGSAAALGAAFADAPLRVGSMAHVVAVTTPSGADYRDARARHLAASADPGGGVA
jgi:sugar (pentulose or hexulose) kinase